MATKYLGIPKYQTPAFRADRALYNALGAEGYAQHRAERQAYYRDLIRQVSQKKVSK